MMHKSVSLITVKGTWEVLMSVRWAYMYKCIAYKLYLTVTVVSKQQLESRSTMNQNFKKAGEGRSEKAWVNSVQTRLTKGRRSGGTI